MPAINDAQNTRSSLTLEQAAAAIGDTELSTEFPGEDSSTTETQPEPQPKKERTAKQVPAERESSDEDEAIEQEEEEQEVTAAEIRRLRIPLPDGEQEIPEDEVVKGYLRQSDYTKKRQADEKAKQEWEEKEVRPLRQLADRYKAGIKVVVDMLTSAPAPDWPTLALTMSGPQLVAEMKAWEKTQKENQDKLALLMQETQGVDKEQQEREQAEYRKMVTREYEQLKTQRPEFADPATSETLWKDLHDFAMEQGYTDQEYAALTDHRAVGILHDAMKYRKAQARAPKVENKVKQAIKSATPGAADSSRPKPNKFAAAKERTRSGRLEDAAKAIEFLLPD